MLDVWFIRRCCTEFNCKPAQAREQADTRFGGAPPHPGVELTIAMSVLHRERGLADAPHTLHGGAPDLGCQWTRDLGHSGWLAAK